MSAIWSLSVVKQALSQPHCLSFRNRNAKSSSQATAGSSHNGESESAGRRPDDDGCPGMVV